MLTPRPYQTETVEAGIAYAAENIRGRLLVVCPPGGGKTLIEAMMMRLLVSDQGLRGLALAHRRELVVQVHDHLVECGIPPEMIGVEMAGDKRSNPTAPIQVASVDTIRHREKPLADFVAWDEAHHDASDGRRKLRALYPDAFHCGFTATPVRLDGRALVGEGCEYDRMIVAAQPSELIAEGWLAVPRIVTVPKEFLPELQGIRRSRGDFAVGELEDRSNRRALVGNIVDHWIQLADGRRTIVFPVGIKHSLAIVAKFRAAGVAAEHVDCDTPHRERALQDLAEGRLLVVSSCGVLSEGTNIPAVKCVVLARPTESMALAIQQPGRALRPWGGVTPLILDHAGNIRRHGLPYDDFDWEEVIATGSERSGSVSAKGRTPIKECHSCHLIVPSGLATCSGCLAMLLEAASVPDERAVKLEEMVFDGEDRLSELERLRRFAQRRGFRPGWAEKVYAAKFGEAA